MKVRLRMIVHAELSCLACGYELGDIEGEPDARVQDMVFLPVHQGDRLMMDSRGKFVCPRCGGRALPHGVTPVRRPLDPGTLYEADILEGINPRLAVPHA